MWSVFASGDKGHEGARGSTQTVESFIEKYGDSEVLSHFSELLPIRDKFIIKSPPYSDWPGRDSRARLIRGMASRALFRGCAHSSFSLRLKETRRPFSVFRLQKKGINTKKHEFDENRLKAINQFRDDRRPFLRFRFNCEICHGILPGSENCEIINHLPTLLV